MRANTDVDGEGSSVASSNKSSKSEVPSSSVRKLSCTDLTVSVCFRHLGGREISYHGVSCVRTESLGGEVDSIDIDGAFVNIGADLARGDPIDVTGCKGRSVDAEVLRMLTACTVVSSSPASLIAYNVDIGKDAPAVVQLFFWDIFRPVSSASASLQRDG